MRKLLLWLSCGTLLPAQTSLLTWHNDPARTGQNLQETILTPANVNSATFGRLFTLSVDGKVDAQPLYVPSVNFPNQGVHNALYVATEHNSAYAFDADTGALLWHVPVGAGDAPSDDRGCGQVTPEIGVTGTPVIDPQAGPHGTMYLVAMSKDSSAKYHQRLHALDLATGAEQFGGPVEIQATYPGSGAENTFNPAAHKARPGLLLTNGVVYTSWSSHCDIGAYAGWVIGYNQNTLQQVSVLNLVPNGSDAALWNAGAGPAADAAANLYALTGNGTFDTSLNAGGFPKNSDYGNAFVKMASTGGPLRVVDYFTMSNTTTESNGDVDLGSGGAMLLPPLNDAQGHSRDLAAGAGKDGHIYVVDRNNLGKFNSGSNAIYQDMPGALPNGVWSSPAWFNGRLYYGDAGGTLKMFPFVNGLFQTTPSSHSAIAFAYPGANPSISANGTSNAIVWAVENSPTAVLHAYDAANLANELYNSNQAANGRDHFGAGNKFIVPSVLNGKVYVGTTNGVGVFGLLCSYAIAPQSAAAAAAGAGGTVNVTAPDGCAWNASSNAAFLTIISGASGSGNGVTGYQVAANSGAQRSGTLTIAGQTFTVNQAADSTLPSLNVSRTSLNFGYSGALITSPQAVALTFTAGAAVSWSATSNQPNISVSPASGSGTAILQVTASPGTSGVITVTAPGAQNSPRQIQVNVAAAASSAPYGSFDTPANNTTGVSGATAVTGWALDGIEVTGVDIWRDPLMGEPVAANGLVFIGSAVFVADARPDVETANPNAPWNYRAGWGYMLLTDLLPSGNGTFRLHAIATGKTGVATDLGTHTITVDNAHAAKPFGTIDTPAQGGAAAGTAYVNFGWALTQNPNSIPVDGSTIMVLVDGVPLGHPVYNQFRSDIAAVFPGLANSGGAVGYLRIDTTALANGVHTIAWVVADSAGHADGIGSRYFNVLNGVAAAPPAEPAPAVDEVTLRTSFDWDAQPVAVAPGPDGAYTLTIDQLGRVELQLGAARGFLLVNGGRRRLPIGSALQNGVFYWHPGPGFLGRYELLFDRSNGAQTKVIIDVRARN